MPDLVALHGFTGASASWLRVRERLPKNVRFFAPDLPGHAGWEGALPSSFETPFQGAVDQLASWIRARTTSAHLVGYSLGARLALGLVIEHPDLFGSVTLIGVRAGLSGEERDGRALRDERLADELLRDGLEAFVDRWEALPLFASQRNVDLDLLAEQRRLRLGHDPAGLAWVLRALSPGRMPDYRPRVGEIRCPARLLVGELDETFVRLARDMLSSACDVEAALEIEVVQGVGHNLLLESPDAVVRALTSALSKDDQFTKQPA